MLIISARECVLSGNISEVALSVPIKDANSVAICAAMAGWWLKMLKIDLKLPILAKFNPKHYYKVIKCLYK